MFDCIIYGPLVPFDSVSIPCQHTELQLPSDSQQHTLTIKCDSAPERTLAVGGGVRRAVEWVGGVEAGSEELTDTARSTLEEVRENCATLDELDPDNKCE